MRVITLNANGIRSAWRKGLADWLFAQEAHLICLQEIRASDEQFLELEPAPGYYSYCNAAEKKGYSGVAAYTRRLPNQVCNHLGWETADREGRFLQLDYDTLSVISIYLPSGSSSEERQQLKFDFLERLMPILRRFRRERRSYIICGDWNIAHRKIDLKNWRGNQKNSGFLPEERAWMEELFGEVGMVDAFRQINQQEDQYTWWSNRGRAWEKNVGWRIDYQVVTPDLAEQICRVEIYRERRFSDHAPLIIDYEVPF